MAVSVFATKIQMTDKDKATVGIVIDSDLGRMEFDVSVPIVGGDPKAAVREAGERVQRFGNELLNKIGTQPLSLSLPPEKA